MSVPANRTRVELEMVLGTDRLKLRAERLSVSSGPAEWQRQAGNGSSYCVMNYVVRDDAMLLPSELWLWHCHPEGGQGGSAPGAALGCVPCAWCLCRYRR